MPFGFCLHSIMAKRIFGMSLNKLFAIAFASFGSLLLVTELALRIGYLRDSFSFGHVWNYLLLFAAYIVLLVMNIRNDDRAYYGISILVFFVGFDGFFGIGDSIEATIYYFTNGAYVAAILSFLTLFLWAGQLAMGILTYIWCILYRSGRSNNFKLLFIFAILFVISIVLTTSATLITTLVISPDMDRLLVLIWILYYLSQILCAIAVVFTLLRLKRLS